jgi:hypothetical protein
MGEPMETGKLFLHSYWFILSSSSSSSASQPELTCLAFLTYFLHKTKYWQTDNSACYMLHAGFLLEVFFFNPEDEGNTFLQKVG